MAVNNLNEKCNQCSSITCPRCTCNPHFKPVNENVARKHVKWNHGHLNPHNQMAVPHSYQKNIDRVPPRVQQKSRDIRYHINLGQFRRATFNAKKLKYTLSVEALLDPLSSDPLRHVLGDDHCHSFVMPVYSLS